MREPRGDFIGTDAAAARLKELRARAARRAATMSHRPDTPEEIAERAEITAAMMPLQMEAMARMDEIGGASVVRVCIDLNVRVRGGLTFTRLDNVEGHISEGQPVEVYESQSGICGPGRVFKIDRRKRLVYLSVDWPALRDPHEDEDT